MSFINSINWGLIQVFVIEFLILFVHIAFLLNLFDGLIV